MSNIYIQEPATNGKVIMKTSLGDIEIELWSKEAPKACRNFIQLCMEGYYDGTIFHRVVKGFIAQGGDPSGNGFGGESVYGEPFKDEFHSRLRFIRRGLVAMANNDKDSNNSQFFFTLGSTPELQNKHTIFGKVVGKTLYNMIKFDDLEVDKNDRPRYPVKIISSEIIVNPFDDIVPRTKKNVISEPKKEKDSRPKGKKDFKVLSFGDEAEEEEEELAQVTQEFKGKSKSLHDMVKNDPKLSSIPAVDPATIRPGSRGNIDDSDSDGEIKTKSQNFSRKGRGKSQIIDESKAEKNIVEDPEESKKREMQEVRKEFEALKKELRKKKVKNIILKRQEPETSSSSVVESFKAETLKHKEFTTTIPKKKEDRAAQTLALLEKFKSKMNFKPGSEEKSAQNTPSLSTADITVLAKHRFTCQKDEETVLAKDANLRNEEDWYDIYDPRNPINKRRREASEMNESKKKRQDK